MDIEKSFTYHPPQAEQVVKYAKIRLMAKELAIFIADNTPESREQSLSIDCLRECVMWANANIAINECKAVLQGDNDVS